MNENTALFEETIEVLKRLKEDFGIYGKLQDTEGVNPAVFKNFHIAFHQLAQVADYYFQQVDLPKNQEQIEADQRKKETERAGRVDPLSEDQYIEGIRLSKKGLSLSKIAKFQGVDENEYRKRHLEAIRLYELTQRVTDKINAPPEGEQDLVLGVRSSPYEKTPVIFQDIQSIRVLLNKGLKPKEIAAKLRLNPESLKSWIQANEKYFNL